MRRRAHDLLGLDNTAPYLLHEIGWGRLSDAPSVLHMPLTRPPPDSSWLSKRRVSSALRYGS